MEENKLHIPLFSIIVPVYNTEKYLNQCIDSILEQKLTDWELILVDDGSKDRSIEIIKEYIKKDQRIKGYYIQGKGPSEPRNFGLRRAQGKYVLFVDSDDYLTKESLTIFFTAISKFPDADYIRGCRRINIDDKEYPFVHAEQRNKYSNRYIDGETYMIDVLNTDFAPTDAIIKKEFLKKNKIEFHEELHLLEDGPFITEICASTHACVWLKDEVYVYRLNSESSLTKKPANYSQCLSLILGSQYYKKIAEKFGKRGQLEMKRKTTDHSLSGLFKACRYLNKTEKKTIFKILCKTHPKLYKETSYNKQHKYFASIYNINHFFSFKILQIYLKLKYKI